MSMCTHAPLPLSMRAHGHLETQIQKLSHAQTNYHMVYISIQLLNQNIVRHKKSKYIPKHDQEQSKNKTIISMSTSKHALDPSFIQEQQNIKEACSYISINLIIRT